MPAPEIPTPQDIPHAFTHVDPTGHLAMLKTIARDPAHIDYPWLVALDTTITEGSESLTMATPPQEADRIQAARERFRDTLLFGEPGHPLEYAYERAHLRMGRGRTSSGLYDVLETLHDITGDAPAMIISSFALLTASARTLRHKFAYMQRIAHALGMETDVRDALTAVPQALSLSEQRLGLLARIAAEFGTEEDRQLEPAALKTLAGQKPESHMVELISWPDYCFSAADPAELAGTPLEQANGVPSVATLQAWIARKAKRAVSLHGDKGDRALRAYFRYRPPDEAQLATTPYIERYVRRASTTPLASQHEAFTAVDPAAYLVTGEESWLEMNENPRHDAAWLQRLNQAAVAGAPKLSKQSERAAIRYGREEFLAELGWTSPGHPLENAYRKLIAADPNLPSTAAIIDICNAFEHYGVSPQQMIAAYPGVLRVSAAKIQYMLKYIDARGLKPAEVMAQNSSKIFGVKADQLEAFLDKQGW